jgi:hypothetical protein
MSGTKNIGTLFRIELDMIGPCYFSRSVNWAVRASTAIYGFTLAIAIAPRLAFPARSGEPVSALHAAGFSPVGPLSQFVVVVLLTAAFAILGTRIARLLDPHRWAAASYCAAVLIAPATLMHFGNLRHVLLAGAAAAGIVAMRRRDPQFTLGDVVLIPMFFSCQMAFLDLGFGRTPVSTSLRAAIAVFVMRLLIRNSDAFVVSPLALIFQIGYLPPTVAGIVAIIVLFGSPLLALRVPRRVVYPIVVFLYPLAVLQLTQFPMNFFEEGHTLSVSSEMLRGERPYRDIIPMHGLITDGVLDAVSLKVSGRSLRAVQTTRLVVGVVSGVSLYSLGVAATGSAEAGLLAAFLAFTLFSGATLWLRPAGAVAALAATVAATRLRSKRWFVVAGALVVIGYLVSVDFGVYSAVVALFAAFRARALRALALGIAVVAVPSLLLFAIFGFALDFIRVNAIEIFGEHGVYFIAPLTIPTFLRSPSFLHHLGDPDSVALIAWVIALAGSAAALARSPLRARRSDAAWLIGVWMVVATMSFVTRGHFYFAQVTAPFLVALLWMMRRHARTVAIVLAVALVVMAEPFRHAITVIPELRAAKAAPLFDPTVESSIAAARRFVSTLGPQDTFVDFSNSALLYELFNRDCPLRQIEVSNYQPSDAQREVIRRIESNPHIRAALITFRGSNDKVDGIPNSERAPLVWEYLQRNFTPAFDENGVVFWRRSDQGHP